MLCAEDLHFSYQGPPILSKLSFSVKPGELVRVSGANGAGKTTLIRIMAGLLKPQMGRIFFKSAAGEREDYASLIGYIAAESNGLFPSLDAFSNLQFWVKLMGWDVCDLRIREELSNWQLGSPLLKGFPVSRFSTGMKRRMAMARISLSQSLIWLLDEPLFGLDVNSIEKVQGIIQRHLDSNGLVIAVSHDLSLVSGLKSREIFLG